MMLKPSRSNLQSSAERYAEQGFAVLPLKPCDKKPIVKHGVHDATNDADTIRQWWMKTPDANIGIACGSPSEVFVIDVDPRNGGDAEFHRLESEYGELPDTTTVKTGRGDGGQHFYFAWPGFRVPNKAIRPGVDLIGDGKYVVAPPSIHPVSKRPYVGEIERKWIADAPKWLLDTIQAISHPATPTESTEETVSSVASVHSVHSVHSVAEAIAATLPTSEGQRRRAIFEFCRYLKAIPQYAHAGADDLLDAIREWHGLALPVIGTKPFDETRMDFINAWSGVRYPKGTGPLYTALQRADATPLPAVASNYEDERLRRLCGLCREMQRLAGDGAFFLPCRSAAALLDMDYPLAAKYLKLLAHDGVLTIAERHTPTRATRYFYAPDDCEVGLVRLSTNSGVRTSSGGHVDGVRGVKSLGLLHVTTVAHPGKFFQP